MVSESDRRSNHGALPLVSLWGGEERLLAPGAAVALAGGLERECPPGRPQHRKAALHAAAESKSVAEKSTVNSGIPIAAFSGGSLGD